MIAQKLHPNYFSLVDREIIDRLIEVARQARENAYAPYSNYRVGAAVLGKSGKIYSGANVENASYGLTICAERTAIFCAVSSGERELAALAVVTENGGYPCGACRQVFAEFADGDAAVIIATATGETKDITTLEGLLPNRFGKGQL